MILKRFYMLAFVFLIMQVAKSQEGMPVYSDYLTDNYYLIHPSMAGAANCAKVRVTGRQQWFGDEDAPSLLTMSINGRIGESNSGIGAILYSDKNGYHSQTGVYLTYAHHIMFSRSEVDLNMLSFGLSVGALQYKLDETAFQNEPFDPIIAGIDQSATNFNIDFGFSYFLYNFYAHATVKNMLRNEGVNSNENGLFAYDNPRQFILSAGNVFQKYGSEWSFEPSLMFMYKDGTKESSIDVNAKAYKDFEFGKLWGGLSYRRSLDGAEYQDGTEIASQKLQYITPILGIDYEQFMFAYTYSYQANSVVYNNGGFHQITLGYKFGCKKERYHCNCPAVN
ncbi:type IX secretion system membrane protein PorP/SprF [Xanthomarina sp. F2636L]|uniref:PorP/SprF family type IX secretion system membrane protein n=1 Tax=Xanthomarina sp. F2636L TaxID=2996018 RepID=UPI00225E33A9|nr:type IX secretion system membrane protein PorP/SprF [Xanthomarina sp. F2636L]MCX7551685.1 type IX secretion system membrane protein PorP/SprF [Xanthomarina sp. F2636L]